MLGPRVGRGPGLAAQQLGQRAPLQPVGRRAPAFTCQAVRPALPDFIPAEFAAEVQEDAAHEMMAAMRRVPVQVPSLGRAVETAFVGPAQRTPGRPAFVLLHGFDSSSLEFRRLLPLLRRLGDVYAVDLIGWGFSDASVFEDDPGTPLGPAQKREHLGSFLRDVLGGAGPVTLIGTSLGGTVAIDFVLANPEAVDALVLVDAQGFIDGIGPMASMPRFLSTLGVKLLRSEWLREQANQIAYHDKERFATADARNIGRLHTHLPGWTEANVNFMQSGGYSVSSRLSQVGLPTLVVWGRQDKILEPKYAQQFMDVLPDAELVWIEEAGHCSHLEQPQKLADAVASFIGSRSLMGSPA